MIITTVSVGEVFKIGIISIRKGGELMEFIGLLAPIAFVFALSALAQVGSLKKEVEKLKEELESKK